MIRRADGSVEYAASGLHPENVRRAPDFDPDDRLRVKKDPDARKLRGKARFLRRTGKGKALRIREDS